MIAGVRALRGALRHALLSAGAGALATAMSRRQGVVFMLHRFRGAGVDGHDPALFDRFCAWLAANPAIAVVPLADLLDPRRLPDGRKPVALTFDDGYADQLDVGGPILARHGLTATVFVTTGFVDERWWMWWDRVQVAMQRADRGTLALPDDGPPIVWSTRHAAEQRVGDVVERLKRIPDVARVRFVEELPGRLGVALAPTAEPAWCPATWESITAWEARGTFRFGPHTLSHPVVSRTSPEQAKTEIAGSWHRLGNVVRAPVPIFCIPNGQPDDFRPGDLDEVLAAGMQAAVTTVPGVVAVPPHGPRAATLVPRMSYGASFDELIDVSTGFESLRQRRPAV